MTGLSASSAHPEPGDAAMPRRPKLLGIRTTVCLDEETHTKVATKARLTGKRMSEVMAAAIRADVSSIVCYDSRDGRKGGPAGPAGPPAPTGTPG
jgi:hypothetical protein